MAKRKVVGRQVGRQVGRLGMRKGPYITVHLQVKAICNAETIKPKCSLAIKTMKTAIPEGRLLDSEKSQNGFPGGEWGEESAIKGRSSKNRKIEASKKSITDGGER